MKVVWTDTAASHLLAIYEHIAKDSPRYAQRMIDRLTARSRQIETAPLLGGRVLEYDRDDIREVLQRPYRIIYRVREDRVDVLAVIHGAQLLPPDL